MEREGGREEKRKRKQERKGRTGGEEGGREGDWWEKPSLLLTGNYLPYLSPFYVFSSSGMKFYQTVVGWRKPMKSLSFAGFHSCLL